jgi:hypothetical protein
MADTVARRLLDGLAREGTPRGFTPDLTLDKYVAKFAVKSELLAAALVPLGAQLIDRAASDVEHALDAQSDEWRSDETNTALLLALIIVGRAWVETVDIVVHGTRLGDQRADARSTLTVRPAAKLGIFEVDFIVEYSATPTVEVGEGVSGFVLGHSARHVRTAALLRERGERYEAARRTALRTTGYQLLPYSGSDVRSDPVGIARRVITNLWEALQAA